MDCCFFQPPDAAVYLNSPSTYGSTQIDAHQIPSKSERLQPWMNVFSTISSNSEHYNCTSTSHSAYVATATESDGVKIDGLLPPNFL